MRNLLSDFFYFNKRERRGIYFLFLLLILIAASNFVMPMFIPKTQFDFEKYGATRDKNDSLLIILRKRKLDSFVDAWNEFGGEIIDTTEIGSRYQLKLQYPTF